MTRPAPYAPVSGTLLCGLLAGACAGPPAAPAPPELSYEVPPYPSTAWVRADTARLEVDAGGRTVEVELATASELDVDFGTAVPEDALSASGSGGAARPAPDGVAVTVRWRALAGAVDDPLRGGRRLVREDVSGPLVFTVSGRGEVRLREQPTLDAEAARLLRPAVTAATFLPALPGRPYAAGLTWTDTVDVREETEGGAFRSRSVMTFTARGDTTLQGRRVLRVLMEGTETRRAEDSGGGVQALAGSSSGYFLWDPALRLPTVWVRRTELEGTLEVEELDFPFSVRARTVTRTYLTQAVEGG